jgi:hypothetical protein
VIKQTEDKQTMIDYFKPGRPAVKPVVMTIVGDMGTGKTSLAALSPNPIFIQAEEGLRTLTAQGIDVATMPSLPSDPVEAYEVLIGQLRWLYSKPHNFKTVVIDSITALERIFVEYILNTDSKKFESGPEDKRVVDKDRVMRTIGNAIGGYGNGYQAVAGMHNTIRQNCEHLRNKRGMNVIFISHAAIEQIRPPDELPFNRYTLRMNEKCTPHYTDNVDVVAFLRLSSYTLTEKDLAGKDKRVKKDGRGREVICYSNVFSPAKNRYGIDEPLEYEKGINPLAQYIPELRLDGADYAQTETQAETNTEESNDE